MVVWDKYGWALATLAGFLFPLLAVTLLWLNGFLRWTLPLGNEFGLAIVSLMLSIVVAAILLIATLLRWLFLRRGGRELAGAVLFCVGCSVGFMPVLFAGYYFKFLTAHYLADRGEPVVAAIEAYVVQEGKVPTSLADLVPGYLPEVPWTGSSLYPNYNLVTGSDTFGGNPWMLEIQMFAVLKWDALYYCPRRNCLENVGYGGWIPVGDWVFLDE